MTVAIDAADVQEALDSVGWDFADETRRASIHALHPYPARFIPAIPRELIRLFRPIDGAWVLDPFCGSGTTLVEAHIAGVPAVGIDLNPIATLLTKVKLTPLTDSLRERAEAAVQRARLLRPKVPPIPNLDHWFARDIQQVVASLVEAVDEERDADTRDALRLALSRILIRVSNQESDTRYAAIEKNVEANDVFGLFSQAATTIHDALSETYRGLFSTLPRAEVITQDVLTVRADQLGQRFGLVITSPPYPNVYEYWLYHKYRMYWLGLDPIGVRKLEIGARPHFFKKNHQTEADFASQMAAVFALLGAVLLPGGLICVVVGRSIIHGRVIDNRALLAGAAGLSGFSEVGHVARAVPSQRKTFHPAHGNSEDSESLIVYGRSR